MDCIIKGEKRGRDHYEYNKLRNRMDIHMTRAEDSHRRRNGWNKTKRNTTSKRWKWSAMCPRDYHGARAVPRDRLQEHKKIEKCNYKQQKAYKLSQR